MCSVGIGFTLDTLYEHVVFNTLVFTTALVLCVWYVASVLTTCSVTSLKLSFRISNDTHQGRTTVGSSGKYCNYEFGREVAKKSGF